jgi:hypothetical protein
MHVLSVLGGSSLGWKYGQWSRDTAYWIEKQRQSYLRLPLWAHVVDEEGESVTDGSLQAARLMRLRAAINEADEKAFLEEGGEDREAFLQSLDSTVLAEEDLVASSSTSGDSLDWMEEAPEAFSVSPAQLMAEVAAAPARARKQLYDALRACAPVYAVSGKGRKLTPEEVEVAIESAVANAVAASVEAAVRKAVEASDDEFLDASALEEAALRAARAAERDVRHRVEGYAHLGEDPVFAAQEESRVREEIRTLLSAKKDSLKEASAKLESAAREGGDTQRAAAVADAAEAAIAETDAQLADRSTIDSMVKRRMTATHHSLTHYIPPRAGRRVDWAAVDEAVQAWRAEWAGEMRA